MDQLREQIRSLTLKHLCIITVFSASCFAADPQPKVESIAIGAAKDPHVECHMERPGALTKNVVIIAPGETICIEVEVQDQTIIARKLIAEPTESSLIFKAWRDGADTFLWVKNELDVSLRYEAVIAPDSQEMTMERTSTCPVPAGQFVLEHWPYHVVVLAASGFSIAASGDSSCR